MSDKDIPLDPPSQAKGEEELAASLAKGEEMRDIVGHGGKGAGGNAIGENADTIRSVAKAQIVDLISEGEIEGIFPDDPEHFLRGVYFDGVPVQNADLSFNFKGIDAFVRNGTQAQTPMPGFSDVENTIAVGVQVKHVAPIVRTIQAGQDLSPDAVRITTSVSSLFTTADDGGTEGTSVQYKIELQSNGGGYVEKINRQISGRASSKFQRADRIPLEGDPPWDIRVSRVTADHSSLAIQDDLFWDAYTEIVEVNLRRPNSAAAGISIDSSLFAHIPVRGYAGRGIRMRVPTNYDPETRIYTGSWDGSFKIAYSNNPAWMYYDLVLADRYGLGNYITAEQINKFALYDIGKYCDEAVDDGHGGTEPRFTCFLYLQKAEEAFSVLQNMAAAFRGMSYWGGSTLNAVQDRPSDAVALYTNANVLDGTFKETLIYSSAVR